MVCPKRTGTIQCPFSQTCLPGHRRSDSIKSCSRNDVFRLGLLGLAEEKGGGDHVYTSSVYEQYKHVYGEYVMYVCIYVRIGRGLQWSDSANLTVPTLNLN